MSSTSKILFVAEPGADVVVQSSDKITFAVRRVSLQASSDVFESMFNSASEDAEVTDSKTGLPLIKLDDKGDDLDLFFRASIRGQDKSGLDLMTFDVARSLFRISDKYQAELVTLVALTRLQAFTTSAPLQTLEIGLKHRHLGLTQAGFANLGGSLKFTQIPGSQGRYEVVGYPIFLSTLSDETLDTLSAKMIKKLFDAEEKALRYRYTHAELARNLTFD